jgi:hypothetical protein
LSHIFEVNDLDIIDASQPATGGCNHGAAPAKGAGKVN